MNTLWFSIDVNFQNWVTWCLEDQCHVAKMIKTRRDKIQDDDYFWFEILEEGGLVSERCI